MVSNPQRFKPASQPGWVNEIPITSGCAFSDSQWQGTRLSLLRCDRGYAVRLLLLGGNTNLFPPKNQPDWQPAWHKIAFRAKRQQADNGGPSPIKEVCPVMGPPSYWPLNSGRAEGPHMHGAHPPLQARRKPEPCRKGKCQPVPRIREPYCPKKQSLWRKRTVPSRRQWPRAVEVWKNLTKHSWQISPNNTG